MPVSSAMSSWIFTIILGSPLLIGAGSLSPSSADVPLLDPAAFDRSAAAHLLSRAGLGGTPEEVEALAAMGLENAVESLLERGNAAEPSPEFEATYTRRPSRAELAGLDRAERQKVNREHRRRDAKQFEELRAWWFQRLVLTRRPLEEKMTLFWHGHFATSQRDVRNSHHMWLQNRMLRTHALGSFRDLLRAVAKDPAMLEYLDNNKNVRQKPNENFARELLELFTLGIGNYTESDIKEAARAFTGWTFEGSSFIFRRRAHDGGEKTFLGRRGNFTGDDIVNAILEEPAASRFLARKLFVFFAHEDPPASVLEAIARELERGRFEVRPALRLLFMSAEFYSARSRGSQIKSPAQLVAGTLRLLGVDPGTSAAFASMAGRMGQDLFLPPNVKGWEGGRSWISTSALFDRYGFSGPILGLERGPRNGAGPRGAGGERGARRGLPRWDRVSGAERVLGKDHEKLGAEEAVDRVIRRFLLVPPASDARAKLIELYREADPATRVERLIHLVLSSPEYQLG
jgi:uncharacterized protein (DUF1800 family)